MESLKRLFYENLGLNHPGLFDKSPKEKKEPTRSPRFLGRVTSIISNLKLYGCKILDTVMKRKEQGHD